MGKRKAAENNLPTFFDPDDRATRRLRRQRALFIPKILQHEASSAYLAVAAQEKAFKIAQNWAKLETDGHLPKYKETSIDTQFLDQFFGEGLGYRVKTANPDSWELEHKFTVAGMGMADGALGVFPAVATPSVVVELKGSKTDLDRDRSNGRTAVQQC